MGVEADPYRNSTNTANWPEIVDKVQEVISNDRQLLKEMVEVTNMSKECVYYILTDLYMKSLFLTNIMDSFLVDSKHN